MEEGIFYHLETCLPKGSYPISIKKTTIKKVNDKIVVNSDCVCEIYEEPHTKESVVQEPCFKDNPNRKEFCQEAANIIITWVIIRNQSLIVVPTKWGNAFLKKRKRIGDLIREQGYKWID